MTISKLANEGGVGIETVRYYQRRGLINEPPRGGGGGIGGGIRHYGPEDLRRLRFVRSAQTAGFTLEEIGELLKLDASNDRPRARAMACNRIVALDSKIRELQAAQVWLSRLANECGASNAGPCPILTAFDS